MIQGTGSDVGKSLLVAGLARAFARRGHEVRPFKPQNMSNNAAVTSDGGEIGRAQALQARAAGVVPHSDMNPVLLKPQSDGEAQIVIRGETRGHANAREYMRLKKSFLPIVLESFDRLAVGADLVLVEGAGSAAEINLRRFDIANMGFAEAADVPVILAGDIERGGVIASLVGTHALLAESERRRVAGYIVNKFRGDISLFTPAIGTIAESTGWDCIGVVPHFAAAARLPAEDSMALSGALSGALDSHAPKHNRPIRIAVPRLPHIANFDDLDPLAAEPDIAIDMIEPGRALPGDADLVILCGSKATRADLAALRAEGWDIDLAAHRRRGGRIFGICGGYQMLGRRIDDPEGVEGRAGASDGLALLDIETMIAPCKTRRQMRGRCMASGEEVAGYEIHMGTSDGADRTRPLFDFDGGDDGATSADGRVQGAYLHGLFAADGFRRAFLDRLAGAPTRPGPGYNSSIEETLDELAAHLEAALDLDRLWKIAHARG